MTRRGDIVRPPGGYGGGHHGAPSAPFNPDGGRVWWRCHTELTADIRGQYVGAFLEVATAAHTTRYDLQAGMVAELFKADGEQIRIFLFFGK